MPRILLRPLGAVAALLVLAPSSLAQTPGGAVVLEEITLSSPVAEVFTARPPHGVVIGSRAPIVDSPRRQALDAAAMDPGIVIFPPDTVDARMRIIVPPSDVDPKMILPPADGARLLPGTTHVRPPEP